MRIRHATALAVLFAGLSGCGAAGTSTPTIAHSVSTPTEVSAKAKTVACRTGQLRGRVVQGGPAGGSFFSELRLRNASAHDCTMRGFARVDLVTMGGEAVTASRRDHTRPISITRLAAHGGTASVRLQILSSGDFSPVRCRPAQMAGLRFTPPGGSTALLVRLSFALTGCTRAGGGVSISPVLQHATIR
jgi:Protein of unknown function (DUF4232)